MGKRLELWSKIGNALTYVASKLLQEDVRTMNYRMSHKEKCGRTYFDVTFFPLTFI